MADARARARGYSLILLAICTIAVAGWIALSDGLIDRNGKPIGTDFSNVYAAGALSLAGPARGGLSSRRFSMRAEKAVFGGREVPFYGWHYPPFFFAVAFAVAAVPYACGLAIWLAGELRRLSRDDCARSCRGRRRCWSRRLSRRCSSISATARTDFSPRRCSAARCICSIAGRGLPAS